MRELTLKYGGDCRRCGAPLAVGTQAIYEKRVGIYCLPCAPKDSEEIRALRQEAGDRRAARLEEWAAKRRAKAAAVFKHNEPLTKDWAFITQPGHIPARARIIAQEDRQRESLMKSEEMERKADSLRHVVVAGDADKRRQAKRDEVLTWLKVGMQVDTILLGIGTVKKINKNTAKIENCGASGTCCTNVELSFLLPVAQRYTCRVCGKTYDVPRVTPNMEDRVCKKCDAWLFEMLKDAQACNV